MKIALKIILLVVFFFGTWITLKQVDWMTLFQIEKAKQTTEEKIGEYYWEFFQNISDEIKNRKITRRVDTLLHVLCQANGIDKKEIKLHILKSNEVNAFALPDKHLVINSSLIAACDNEAELVGVMAHELAHIQKGHVMKKLVKEIGLTTLISVSSGNGGAVMVKKIAKLLSSSAYDRQFEREADLTGADFLIKANLDPEGLSNFLFKLSKETNMPDQFYWISTHPESKERAEDIIAYCQNKKTEKKSVLSSDDWKKLQEALEEE